MKKEKEAPVEKAFKRSDKHVFDGLKLFPWTPARMIAAQSVGMRFPRIGEEAWDELSRSGTYPGCLRDVIICLWLATRTEDEVDEADRWPEKAYSDAKKWATEHELHSMRSAKFWEGFNKFSEIMKEGTDSATKPKATDDDDDDDPKD